MSHHLNIVRIKGVYNALGDLGNKVVFVGGATVSLYADRPEQAEVRPTEDVDVLIEIATYNEYVELQAKLTALDFRLDTESSIICRYKYHGLTIDIMPIDEGILGFTNRWYKEGFAKLERFSIDERTTVNIFSSTFFLASKLEAYKGRGNLDGRTSQDFEDIVFILDNRKTIWEEIRSADLALKMYFKNEWENFLANPFIEEWLAAHLEYQTAAIRGRSIISEMRKFVAT